MTRLDTAMRLKENILMLKTNLARFSDSAGLARQLYQNSIGSHDFANLAKGTAKRAYL
jgi:hypothetical protein